jgi:phosphonate metabolism protein PhnN/1,5-bisphosphokinase (PRPP-forming)
MTSRGTIILIVGPSGSGKDSILAGAEAALETQGDFFFPRRDITRPQSPGHEPYRSLSEEAFFLRQAEGAYSLSWSAHGLYYGVPREIEQQLADGRHVVVNVSRNAIPEIRERLRPVRVVSIEVPRDILRERLKGRNRESDSEIEGRLSRATAFQVEGPDVISLRNDSSLESAIEKFVILLRNISRAADNAPVR